MVFCEIRLLSFSILRHHIVPGSDFRRLVSLGPPGHQLCLVRQHRLRLRCRYRRSFRLYAAHPVLRAEDIVLLRRQSFTFCTILGLCLGARLRCTVGAVDSAGKGTALVQNLLKSLLRRRGTLLRMLNGKNFRRLRLLRPLVRRLLAALQKLRLGNPSVTVGIVQRKIDPQRLRHLCSLQSGTFSLTVRMLSGKGQIQSGIHFLTPPTFCRLGLLFLPLPAAGIPIAAGRGRKLFKILPGTLPGTACRRNRALGQHPHQGLLRDIDKADQNGHQKQQHCPDLSEDRMQKKAQSAAYGTAPQGSLRAGFEKLPEAHALHAVARAKSQYAGKKDQHKKRCCHLQHRMRIVRIGQKKDHRKQQHQRKNIADGTEKPQLQSPEGRPDRAAKSEIAEQQKHGNGKGHDNGNLISHQRLILHFCTSCILFSGSLATAFSVFTSLRSSHETLSHLYHNVKRH